MIIQIKINSTKKITKNKKNQKIKRNPENDEQGRSAQRFEIPLKPIPKQKSQTNPSNRKNHKLSRITNPSNRKNHKLEETR